MTDVLVVGASVAGSTVALSLVGHGFDVKLIDRAAFPRRKTCGEGVFPAGVRVLDELGVLEGLRAQATPLTSLSLIGYGASATSQASGLGVRRELLDAALLHKARDRGVEVELGVTATGLIRDTSMPERFVGVETDRGEMCATVVVAADGLGSRLRHAAGLHKTSRRRRYGVSAHFELAEERDGVEVYFQPGYEVYLTPIGGALVNVAVLLDATKARALGGRLEGAFDALACDAAPRLRDGKRFDAPLAAGPFPAAAKRRWEGNLVLAGDAGGFFDGITGEGMSLALVGAQRCSAAVEAFLVDGDETHFARYDRAIKALQRPSTLMARLSLALAARPALGRRAIANLARRPETLAKLIRVSQGETPLSSLRPRDAVALLLGV
jgi:flavin-dependent dehydrogenase